MMTTDPPSSSYSHVDLIVVWLDTKYRYDVVYDGTHGTFNLVLIITHYYIYGGTVLTFACFLRAISFVAKYLFVIIF